MKTVLIGGSGFIGTRIARLLLAQSGHTLVIADTRRSEQFPEFWVECDVRNPEQLRDAIDGADCVVNLAAVHKDDVRPADLYYKVNVEGTERICQIADELGVSNMIFTSSVAVYGPTDGEVDETALKLPQTDYGKSKLQAEELYLDWASKGNNLTIVRPTVVFGEGNRGNLFTLIDQVRRRRFLMVGSGSNIKSMAYVENLAAFIEMCIENLSGVQTYNYVDKPDLTMNELVSYLYERVYVDKKPIRIPYLLGLFGGAVFDALARISGRNFPISKLRIRKFCANTIFAGQRLQETGFTPPYSLLEGLQRTVDAELEGDRSTSPTVMRN